MAARPPAAKETGKASAATVKAKRGRPSTYQPALFAEICERLAFGETLRVICRDPRFPHCSTVMRWLLKFPECRSAYAFARQVQADVLAEQVLEIANDGAGDVVQGADGKELPNWENVQRSRLRCDALKWFVGKLAPKKYGERVLQEHSGPDGGPMETQVSGVLMPPAEVGAAVRSLLSEIERELGVTPSGRAGAKARLKRIVEAGGVMPPTLYAALFAGKAKT